MSRKPAAIIVAPPWPNTGSSHVFSAQAAAHKQSGREVLLLLGPVDVTPRAIQDIFWRDAQREMHYEGVSRVAVGPTSDTMRRFRGDKSFWEWLAAGCDDSLSIRARYAADGRWRAEIIDFIDSHQIDIVHVNHAFEMLLGIKVQELVSQRTGAKPYILCDTHDIQAHAYAGRSEKNPFSGRTDKYSRLIASELVLYRTADMLLHCSRSDMDFFQTALPHMRHKLVMPCLHPQQEEKLGLSSIRGGNPEFDFLYVGNNNFANFAAVKWLLTEVLPQMDDLRPRIGIVGQINEFVRRMDATLYKKFQSFFVGPVPDAGIYYCISNTVLAPSLVGTGCSIKFIEALCAGKTVIATMDSIRGFPEEVRHRCREFICDTPRHFADTMTKTLGARHNFNTRARAIYDDFFHSRHYFRNMNNVFKEIFQIGQRSANDSAVPAEQTCHAQQGQIHAE
jgi:glycosyltransferase involved in cell wall biosynthesis